MKIIRSFPKVIPEGRAYVADDIERHLMQDYDYAWLRDVGDDVLLLEWDIAVSVTDLTRFAARCQFQFAAWPLVAPYEIGGHQAHWREVHGAYQPIRRGDPDCDLFGFGMAYFPAWVLRDCPPRFGGSTIMGDGTLPRWLRTLPNWRPVPVDWSVSVVHLH